MEVIKHGNTGKITKCKKCGCNFLHYENEREVECSFDDYYGEIIHDYKIIIVECPECSKRNTVQLFIDGKEEKIDES